MKTHKENDLVEVFAGTAWQAEMVRSLLENVEIRAFVKDGIMGTMNPWWTAPGGAGAVSVYVPYADSMRAVEVVLEYEKNLNR